MIGYLCSKSKILLAIFNERYHKFIYAKFFKKEKKMDNNRLISIIALMVSLSSFGYSLYGNSAISKSSGLDSNKEGIASIIRQTLNENPEIIIESVEKYRASKAEEEFAAQKEKIKTMSVILESNPLDPKIGPDNASVKIVEFFDYNCGHCVKMSAIKSEILKTDPDIQIIFKELPIMSPNSTQLSQASIAVYQIAPDMYPEFQKALFNSESPLETEGEILSLASKIGIDSEKLKAMMADPKISEIINNNIKTAQSIGLRGTPFYIINGDVIPGSSSIEEFRKRIENIRAKKSSEANPTTSSDVAHPAPEKAS